MPSVSEAMTSRPFQAIGVGTWKSSLGPERKVHSRGGSDVPAAKRQFVETNDLVDAAEVAREKGAVRRFAPGVFHFTSPVLGSSATRAALGPLA